MRIDSTDAGISSDIYRSGRGQSTNAPKQAGGQVEDAAPDEQVSAGNPVSEKAVIQAIEKANKAIHVSNRHLEFSVHEKTKEIMVKIVDSETKEIVREIPPEKVLDMVANILQMAGILVDERR